MKACIVYMLASFGYNNAWLKRYGLQVFVLTGRPVHPMVYKQVR